MAKKSNFTNMVLTLFIITAAAAAALGYVYEFTDQPRKMAATKKVNKALEMVLPKFAGNPGDNMFKIAAPAVNSEENSEAADEKAKKDSIECYPAYGEDGKLVGIAVKSFTKSGFSGLIRVMVGFKPDGTINDTFVLEHKETPGLGTEMKEAGFKNQFEGVEASFENQIKVNKDGGKIDAITAATISSRAFCDAVNTAGEVFKQIKDKVPETKNE